MKLQQIRNGLNSGLEAFAYANKGRKLVRQVDTGGRHYDKMTTKTKDVYTKMVQNSGHHSINPVKRIVAFVKAWNMYRKNLSELFNKF